MIVLYAKDDDVGLNVFGCRADLILGTKMPRIFQLDT